MSYSQNNEEEVILAELAALNIQHGRFLDIGAYDGKAFSNTLRLAELGWMGVCVEPSPSVFHALLTLHGSNPQIQLVNAAVGAHGAQLTEFWDSSGDAISTTSQAHMLKWKQGWKTNFKSFFIYTVPLRELLAVFGYNFTFINIDVEGNNWELFQALPFDALDQTRIICVEHDGHMHEMTAWAGKYKYRAAHTNGENLILVR